MSKLVLYYSIHLAVEIILTNFVKWIKDIKDTLCILFVIPTSIKCFARSEGIGFSLYRNQH